MAEILMIDDDRESIEDIRDILSSTHHVDVAGSVDDAVDLLKKKRYDVLFLDLYIPHGQRYGAETAKLGRETGYLLLRDIRSPDSGFETQGKVPVIVLTFIRLNMDTDLRDRLMELQPLECVEKPESLPNILQLVESMFKRACRNE